MHRRWHYADETERRQWQDPEAVMAAIGLKPVLTFMDIGCGEGFFTIPAARIVGSGGKVYGVDIEGEAIDHLQKKAAAEGLTNLELITGKAEELILCHSCADIVFFGNVLHDFQDPAEVVRKARDMLKPDGRLVNLDWKKVDMSFGPPKSRRFDEAAAIRLIEPAGFKVEYVKNSGQYHYLILARSV